LLTRFYLLTVYVTPLILPEFAGDLCRAACTESRDAIALITFIHAHEPLIVKQSVSPTLVGVWQGSLVEYLFEASQRSEDVQGTDGDPSEYDEWHSESERLVGTAQEFSDLAEIGLLEGLDRLKAILESAERPPEMGESTNYEEPQAASEKYWTVERIFEDL
jgi:hypothetical protein